MVVTLHQVCRGVGRRRKRERLRKRDVTLVIIVACMHVVLIIIDDVDLCYVRKNEGEGHFCLPFNIIFSLVFR